jgi:hypothetical protein
MNNNNNLDSENEGKNSSKLIRSLLNNLNPKEEDQDLEDLVKRANNHLSDPDGIRRMLLKLDNDEDLHNQLNNNPIYQLGVAQGERTHLAEYHQGMSEIKSAVKTLLKLFDEY